VTTNAASTVHKSMLKGTEDPAFVPPVVAVGQIIKVELVGDTLPLTASSYSDVSAYEQNIKLKAPVQAVDAVNKTITVLGLTVDISTATADGANDDHSLSVPIATASLVVGQNAEIYLDGTKLPALSALRIQVRNFSNQVAVHMTKEHGAEIENEVEAIHVEVEQKISVLDSHGKKVNKTSHQVTETHNGVFDLSGLSPGRARITVVRNGTTVRKSVTIKPNMAVPLAIKLRR
jgi:hypothetical protein